LYGVALVSHRDGSCAALASVSRGFVLDRTRVLNFTEELVAQ